MQPPRNRPPGPGGPRGHQNPRFNNDRRGGRPDGRPDGRHDGRPDGRPNGRPGGPPRRAPDGPRNDGRPSPDAPWPVGLRVLRDDPSFIAVEKPAGLVDMQRREGPRGSGGGKRTAFDHVEALVQGREGLRGRLFIVQHLDRDASGVLVFARTKEAAILLGEAFRTRRAMRTYAAIVCGAPEGEGGSREPNTVSTIHTLLVDNRRGVVDAVPIGSELDSGRAAPTDREPARGVTHYRVQKSGPSVSLLRVRAETDYPYQVRAHLASIGLPVAGDKAYGAKVDPLGRLALHLGEVSMLHPVTGEEVRLRAATPEGWKEVVDAVIEPEKPKDVETASGGWDEVAEWYGSLMAERRSDLHEGVVWPGTRRLLKLREGERFLDVACGPGDLAGHALDVGASYTGVDASERLVSIARERFDERARFLVGDAERLAESGSVEPGTFDACACVLALMNMGDLTAATRGMAAMLKPGGRAVMVVLHPAFRSPKLSGWGWDEDERGFARQYRRVDAYLGEQAIPVVMNPGAVAKGERPVTTTTWHRSMERYLSSLIAADLRLSAVEAWTSHRYSEPGPRADAENFARREFPMFLALKAEKPI